MSIQGRNVVGVLIGFLLFMIILAVAGHPQVPSPETPTVNRPGLSLRETFDLYVRSIQKSDLQGLFSTVADRPEFFFLTSAGELIETRQGYYRFHADWFKEKDWEMPVERVTVHEGQTSGYTTAIYHYTGRLPDGGRYRLDSWFTLVFEKEGGMWKVVADVCTPIKKSYLGANPEFGYTAEQAFLFAMIKNRRTVRRFQPTPVPREHLLKILDAARFAPTSGNQQPWKFLVIENRQTLDELKKQAVTWYADGYERQVRPTPEDLAAFREKLGKTMENVLSAPVYIAVLTDSKSPFPRDNAADGPLAAGTLMIAARALGYGTGYFTTFFPEDKMKKFLAIPKQYNLVCFTPVGTPVEWPATPPKRPLEELVVFNSFPQK